MLARRRLTLNNVKLVHKIRIPIFVLSFALILITVVLSRAMSHVSDTTRMLADESMKMIELVLKTERDLFQAQMIERSLIFVKTRSDDFKLLSDLHDQTINDSRRLVEELLLVASDESTSESAKAYLAYHQEWEKLTRKVQSERAADTRAGRNTAIDISFGSALENFDKMREQLTKLAQRVQENASQSAVTAINYSAQASTQSNVLLLLALVISVALALLFPKVVLSPIKRVLEGIENVRRQGDFSFRLDMQQEDEIGAIAKYFDELMKSLQTIITQCNHTVTNISQGQAGDRVTLECAGDILTLKQGINRSADAIEQSMNEIANMTSKLAQGLFDESATSLEGSYGKTINDGNSAKRTMRAAIYTVNDALERLAQGDFSARIVEDLPGELSGLKRDFNRSASAVEESMSLINQVMSDLAKGNFDSDLRSDLPGEYGRTISNGLEAKLTLRSAIKETETSLTAMANGDFSYKISSLLPGELENLKRAVNLALDNIQLTLSEMTTLSQKIASGDFDYKSNAKLSGAFGITLENLNASAGKMGSTIQEILFVMSELEQGNFSFRIEQEMEGDLEQLKLKINSTLNQLELITGRIGDTLSSLSKGDLRERISLDCQGAFENLKSDVNTTVDNLNSIVNDIALSADQVNQSSNQIIDGSRQLGDQMGQTSSSVESTKSALASILDANAMSVKSIRNVSEQCTEASTNAVTGELAMQEVLESVVQISESSSKIESILGTINDISFQTNLLALNASVEAARAGESGRGFSVVASEVRGLAQRSSSAAKEIKELISEILNRVGSGKSVAENSSKVLSDIVSSFSSVTNAVQDVRASIERQNENINEIQEEMNRVDRNTRDSLSMSEKSVSASLEAGRQAQQLTRLVDHFAR